MHEELSNKRMLIILAALVIAIVIVFAVCIFGVSQNQQAANVNKPPSTTTTTTVQLQADSGNHTTTLDGSMTPPTTQRTTRTNGTTSYDDRYDFPTETTSASWLENFYQVTLEFDGWQLYYDNAVYDAEKRTLSVDLQQLCTRRNAQPIYYTASVTGIIEDLPTSEVQLPTPNFPDIYLEMDHFQAKKVRITVEDVPPDFMTVFFRLETLSVPDDAGANATGKLVYKTVAIRSDQATHK